MFDVNSYGFAELSCDELTEVDGGIAWAFIGRCAIKIGKAFIFFYPKMYTFVE